MATQTQMKYVDRFKSLFYMVMEDLHGRDFSSNEAAHDWISSMWNKMNINCNLNKESIDSYERLMKGWLYRLGKGFDAGVAITHMDIPVYMIYSADEKSMELFLSPALCSEMGVDFKRPFYNEEDGEYTFKYQSTLGLYKTMEAIQGGLL